MMDIDSMIAVLRAAKAGKQIQAKYHGETDWHNIREPPWNFLHSDYRVKPEPREWMALPNDLDKLNAIAPCKVGAIKVREVLE